MAASRSRSSRFRIRVPSTTSPVAQALPAHHNRGIRTSRTVCPYGDVCTCTGRIRHPPGRTTCRSPCKGISAAVAPGVRLHAPKWVLLPFDRADLVERLDLVMGQIRPPPQRARIGITIGRQINGGDVLYVDLPEADARALRGRTDLTHDEIEALDEICTIKRKEDPFWGM